MEEQEPASAGDDYVCPHRGRVPAPPAHRVIAKLIGRSPADCWLWSGGTSLGYGMVADGATRLRVHRVMYEAVFGPIPDGLVLDHTCKTKNCCNPTHLEPVTIGENVRRAHDPDLYPCGHARSTSRRADKRCSMCNAAYQRTWKARRRSAVAP